MRNTLRYGRERIRRGLAHFMLGKGLSSIAGFAVLVLLIRHLSVPEFAAYSVLQAFVELFTALTGFGLTHAALRYVPELYAGHQNRVFRGFIVTVFGLRLVLLTLVTSLAYLAGNEVAGLFGLDAWVAVFRAYLVVVWLRVNAHFLFQILESTLHQGLGQAALVTTVLSKLVLIVLLIWQGTPNIEKVIWTEAAAEALGLAVLLFCVARVLRASQTERGMPALTDWWSTNAGRVTRFGLAGYLQHLAILPYGSAPNRLLAGRFLEVGALAAFGFAQSFADMLRRYLPAQLLGGLIRPILVARYSTGGHFHDMADVLALIFRVNAILLGGVAGLLLAVGPNAVHALSGGKYGGDAAWLLLALIGVLVLESRRFLIELLVQAVERNGLLVAGNLSLAASLLLAIFLLPIMGALAIPLAAATGLAASTAWIAHRLSQEGFVYPFGYVSFARILAATGLSALIGYAAQGLSSWDWGAFAVFLFYPICVWLTGATGPNDWRRLRMLIRPVR